MLIRSTARAGARPGPAGRARRARASALAGAALAALSGCALVERGPGAESGADAATARAAEAAAADLVAALVQLREPRTTTVQVGPEPAAAPSARSRGALVAALADAGYGIQRVAADQGANLLDWRFGPADEGDRDRLRARLAVGAVALRRDYRPAGRGLVAVSPLEISGTRADVALDDATRLPGTAPEHSRTRVAAAGPSLAAAPIIRLVTDDVVRGVAARATGGRAGPPAGAPVGASRRAVNSNRVEVVNLFFGESAFGSLRADLETVERGTILFGDDSMRLGPDGKRQIARFVERYRPETDLFGLVGCSNGPTRLAIGNEGLALGRSARVTDELVALGVERSRILDEGCWAGRAAKGRFPSRGVVIELLRDGA